MGKGGEEGIEEGLNRGWEALEEDVAGAGGVGGCVEGYIEGRGFVVGGGGGSVVCGSGDVRTGRVQRGGVHGLALARLFESCISK